MGLVGSKDESGKVVLGALPPGFLDYRGRDLRDKLDMCLAANMWFFTIGAARHVGHRAASGLGGMAGGVQRGNLVG